MNTDKQVISPEIKLKPAFRKGLLGLLDMQRFIKQHGANGGTLDELEKMGFKFGTMDVNKITMEPQTVTATQPPEHKGIVLFKKAQAKKKFVTEHLAKGGTVEELRQMGFKFGTLDLHNLTSKRP